MEIQFIVAIGLSEKMGLNYGSWSKVTIVMTDKDDSSALSILRI